MIIKHSFYSFQGSTHYVNNGSSSTGKANEAGTSFSPNCVETQLNLVKPDDQFTIPRDVGKENETRAVILRADIGFDHSTGGMLKPRALYQSSNVIPENACRNLAVIREIVQRGGAEEFWSKYSPCQQALSSAIGHGRNEGARFWGISAFGIGGGMLVEGVISGSLCGTTFLSAGFSAALMFPAVAVPVGVWAGLSAFKTQWKASHSQKDYAELAIAIVSLLDKIEKGQVTWPDFLTTQDALYGQLSAIEKVTSEMRTRTEANIFRESIAELDQQAERFIFGRRPVR